MFNCCGRWILSPDCCSPTLKYLGLRVAINKINQNSFRMLLVQSIVIIFEVSSKVAWTKMVSSQRLWTQCQFPVNSLRPRQNRRHFADDVFKCNFLNENVWIPIKISLKFVPRGPINIMPTLVKLMAWRRTGDKPLSEPMMTRFNDAYMRHSASMS